MDENKLRTLISEAYDLGVEAMRDSIKNRLFGTGVDIKKVEKRDKRMAQGIVEDIKKLFGK